MTLGPLNRHEIYRPPTFNHTTPSRSSLL